MGFELAVFGLAFFFMLILIILGYITEIGFLFVGAIVIGMYLDGSILLEGGTISWGTVTLDATTGGFLLVLASVFTIISSGLLIMLRYTPSQRAG